MPNPVEVGPPNLPLLTGRMHTRRPINMRASSARSRESISVAASGLVNYYGLITLLLLLPLGKTSVFTSVG
jgi:hypothetical protein